MSIPQSIDVSTGSTWCDQRFVGAHFYRSTVRKLQKVATVTEDGALRFPISLVPEPDNPYSKSGCAISVRWNGKTIGHLPDDDATKYWPELCRIAASGHVATAHARLRFRGSLRDADTKLFGSVDVRKPGQWVPLNDPPLEGYAFIPQGGRIQVTKEADHFDVLQDFVPPQGTGLLIVTLHRVLVGKNGDLPRVEVRLDGERVGELSKISSEKLLPAVEYFETLGLSTSCIAQIKGSSLAAELILLAQKATEMGDELLNPEISPLPVLVEFEATRKTTKYPLPGSPQATIRNARSPPKPPPEPQPRAAMIHSAMRCWRSTTSPWFIRLEIHPPQRRPLALKRPNCPRCCRRHNSHKFPTCRTCNRRRPLRMHPSNGLPTPYGSPLRISQHIWRWPS